MSDSPDLNEVMDTCDGVFVLDRAASKTLDEWAEVLTVRTFAEGLGRMKRSRGGENWIFFLTAVLDDLRADGYVLTRRQPVSTTEHGQEPAATEPGGPGAVEAGPGEAQQVEESRRGLP